MPRRSIDQQVTNMLKLMLKGSLKWSIILITFLVIFNIITVPFENTIGFIFSIPDIVLLQFLSNNFLLFINTFILGGFFFLAEFLYKINK